MPFHIARMGMVKLHQINLVHWESAGRSPDFGVYTPLTPQNLALTTANPKEPLILVIFDSIDDQA